MTCVTFRYENISIFLTVYSLNFLTHFFAGELSRRKSIYYKEDKDGVNFVEPTLNIISEQYFGALYQLTVYATNYDQPSQYGYQQHG